MATLYSAEITNRDASPPVMTDYNAMDSKLKVAYATYTLTGSEATGDVIQMVALPKGARIWCHLSHIWWDDLGTTFTFDVGDGVDVDRYCEDLVGGTVSTVPVPLTDSVTLTQYTYEQLADDTVDINCVSVGTPTATSIIRIVVVYSLQG